MAGERKDYTAKDFYKLLAPCDCTAFDRTHEVLVHYYPQATQTELDHLRTELKKFEQGHK